MSQGRVDGELRYHITDVAKVIVNLMGLRLCRRDRERREANAMTRFPFCPLSPCILPCLSLFNHQTLSHNSNAIFLSFISYPTTLITNLKSFSKGLIPTLPCATNILILFHYQLKKSAPLLCRPTEYVTA